MSEKDGICTEFRRQTLSAMGEALKKSVWDNFREKKEYSYFYIIFNIYLIFVYKYERILVGALHMPSTSSRRFTFCTTVPVCHHLLWASCLLPNTKISNPASLQGIGFISALCKNE